jgi:hypothetical protein
MPRHAIIGAVIAFLTLGLPACAPVRPISAPQNPSGPRSPSVGAQPGGSAAIRGRVLDANTARPLRRAVVRSTAFGRHDNHAVATDEQGRLS